MALILNIDSALDTASVCLATDNEVLQLISNENQKDHAAWLHTAIANLLQRAGFTINDLEAVAVSIGPGSYTGLRVGLASAKGLCYALNIPLIAISTLKMIAFSSIGKAKDASFICPMIDARRMEVFTCLYDTSLNEIIPPQAIIIEKENIFPAILESKKILFCGNGSKKLQAFTNSGNALYDNTVANASHLVPFSNTSFRNKEFSSLAYCEPVYIKEFYSSATRMH